MIFNDINFNNELIKILFDKGIIGMIILGIGYFTKKSIEKWKSDDTLRNEITKVRIERISKFYDLFSEYEHWINRLVTHTHDQIVKNKLYLSEREFEEAKKKSTEISNRIGFELNQMRFWINDDIYWHTVAQIELFREMQHEVLKKGNIEIIKDYAFKFDSIRMNIDKLVPYLKSNQELKLVSYDRSFLYKKSSMGNESEK